LANDYSELYPQLITCTHENIIQSSYAARNKGLEISKGQLISFIDANVEVGPDFLLKVNDRFSQSSVDYLGVKIIIRIDRDTLSARYNSINDFQVSSDIKYNHYTPTCCLVVRRTVIDKVGSFDQRLESGGDWDFGQRVYQAGFIQMFDGKIVVYHPARWSYKSLINKSKRVARGVAQLSYYNFSEYNYLFRSHFYFRRFLPSNPFKLYSKYKAKYNNTTYGQITLFAFFHLPLRVIAFIELIKEKIRLHIAEV
jgi:GT2 family glycosyltransferase